MPNSVLSRSIFLISMIVRSRVEREIEVSHWGNIAIEEAVNARNSGTPLTGEFSRLDYYRSDPDLISAWGNSFLLYNQQF